MKEPNKNTEIVLYTTADGRVKIDTIFQHETIWLTQAKMAELFDVNVPAISKHLKNTFETGELDEKVVVSILEKTTKHGAISGKTQKKAVKYYNLDAIIAVGYKLMKAGFISRMILTGLSKSWSARKSVFPSFSMK